MELHDYADTCIVPAGMWADEDDDRRSSKKSKERKSYTTPVAFVSGGVKVGDRVTKNDGKNDLNITVSNAVNCGLPVQLLYQYGCDRIL